MASHDSIHCHQHDGATSLITVRSSENSKTLVKEFSGTTSFVLLFLWKNLISYDDYVGLLLCFFGLFFCVLHCIFTYHALEVLGLEESRTCDAFCRKNICSENAIHRLETTRPRGLRGLKSVWFCLSLRCSSALKHFAPALYFIPAIVTFSKQKQTPLYKISKKACRHSSARHLMGINYACFFCCCFFPRREETQSIIQNQYSLWVFA